MHADRPPPGEGGLASHHGLAFFGPCSDQKVRLEARRLQNVDAAIRAKGFNPDRYGDIEGHVITDGQRAVFFIMGGKHRAAALAHQGASHIPVRFREGHPRVAHTRDIAHWPMVHRGELSPQDAGTVAHTYLDGRGMSDVMPPQTGKIGK